MISAAVLKKIAIYYDVVWQKPTLFPISHHMHPIYRLECANTDQNFVIKQYQKKSFRRDIEQLQVIEGLVWQLCVQEFPALAVYKLPEAGPLCQIHDEVFALYAWIDGSIKHPRFTDGGVQSKIVQLLAKLHRAFRIEDLPAGNLGIAPWAKAIDAEECIQLCQEAGISGGLIADYFQKFEQAKGIIDQDLVFSHGDLYPHNVLWVDDREPVVVDWESAGWLNRDLDVLNVAVNWAGVAGKLFDLVKLYTFVYAYNRQSDSQIRITSSLVHASYGSWLAWIGYQLANKGKRAEVDASLLALKRLDKLADMIV